MAEGYRPKRTAAMVRLSERLDGAFLIRVKCFRRGTRHYDIADIIPLFGDVRILELGRYVKRCESCGERDSITVRLVHPSAEERQQIKVRKLVEVRTVRRPVWK